MRRSLDDDIIDPRYRVVFIIDDVLKLHPIIIAIIYLERMPNGNFFLLFLCAEQFESSCKWRYLLSSDGYNTIRLFLCVVGWDDRMGQCQQSNVSQQVTKRRTATQRDSLTHRWLNIAMRARSIIIQFMLHLSIDDVYVNHIIIVCHTHIRI